MRQTCHEVLDELGITDEPLLDLAMELERIALEDEYFVEKKLYPNVDFYSGIISKLWAFRRPCLPFCLPLREQLAGLPNGTKWWRIQVRGLGARASCIWASRRVTT